MTTKPKRGRIKSNESHDPTIRAKRAASSPEAIKKKRDAGEPHAERAVVRVGRRNTAILTGAEDLSEWTEEELVRGQRKDKNGKWQGRPPSVVPKAIHDELVKRTLKEGAELMRTALVPACRVLATILEDEDAEDRDKIKAATIIMDRVLGKTPERVEVHQTEEPWFDALVESIVSLPEGSEVVDLPDSAIQEAAQ